MNKRKNFTVNNIMIYGYIAFAIFPLFPLMGVSIGNYFESVYDNFQNKWIATVLICIFSGSLVTAFPMLFLIEFSTSFKNFRTPSLHIVVIIGWVGGIIMPIFFNFQSLSLGLITLLLLTTLITYSEILGFMHELSRNNKNHL